MSTTRTTLSLCTLPLALALALSACADDPAAIRSETASEATATRTSVETATVAVRGTTLAIAARGSGRPLLLIHGGGEDATMLAAQAASLAAAGFRVITYDRRGTGRSGREDWPGDGAAQHADDAAALIETLGLGPTTVVGVSSGGVIALALAARHPDAVARVVAWEPPALGVRPGAAVAQRALMTPARRHLKRHPGDFVGAQAILLRMILGVPVSVDDPAFAATRANAEPMIRDEPAIPVFRFRRSDLSGRSVTVATGPAPFAPIRWAATTLSRWSGHPVVHVDADHEVYLTQPEVLTRLVADTEPTSEAQP